MTSPTIFTVVTTKLNVGQSAANTGADTQNPDGSFDTFGAVLGTTQTVQSTIELATLGKSVGNWLPLTGGVLSLASGGAAAKNISDAWSSGRPIDQSDLAALVGSAAGLGGAVIVLVGASGPIMVTLSAVAITTSVVAGGYQLYASAKGLTVDVTTGKTIEVNLTAAQMAQIDQHLQQTMPLWSQTSTMTELGFVTGAKVQTLGSVFSAAATNSNSTPAPSGLDTASRNSSALINTTGAYTTQFNSGGGVDDLWVVEKNAGRYVGTRDQFRADFVASNGQVDPNTLGVQLGQTYYVPQRSANGNTVYHYSNGATVMNNAVTGEYLMEVPNTDGSGGKTVYSRTADDVGYTVRQVTTNAAGAVVFENESYQNTLDAELSPVSASSTNSNQTTTRNWFTDNVYQTDTFVGPPAPNAAPSTSSLNVGDTTYNLKDSGQRNDAAYEMDQRHDSGLISTTDWNSYTADDAAAQFDGGSTFTLPTTGSNNFGADAIGAFYDSQSSAYDNAVSIANKTTRAMNASGQALSSAQLAALDANGDGQLSTSEASGVRLWADVNEDGRLDSGELQSVGSAIKSADYGFYTRGNGQAVSGVGNAPTAPGISVSTQRPQSPTGSAPGTPSAVALPTASSFVASGLPTAPVYTGVPASNYRTLRDTDNVYYVPNGWITFSASQVKINNSNRTYLIGTDGADSFDASYYASYTQYFNSSLLVNFLGGGGDDEMGGSTRNDNLWGGTGNDTVYGYAGDDKVYGEEGDDVLVGQDGNDSLDGGIGNDALVGGNGDDAAWGGDGADELQGNDGTDQLMGQSGNDRLFGQVGNDTLWGGDGDDFMQGFTASNDAQQSLNAGQTDNDVLMGEGGNDEMHGGVGNDLLDGGVGNDLLDGGAGDDTLQGQAGVDTLYGGDGADQLDGGVDNDFLLGDAGDDRLWGGDGADEIQGGDGTDQLMGQSGNDRLFGQVGNDTLWGGDGDDFMQGFTASNDIQQSLNAGQTDNDVLMGEGGNDEMHGGVGNDLLDGGVGNDLLDGGAGDDTLQGQAGVDTLYGGDGADQLDGGVDNDFLLGDAGDDRLWGGDGADEIQGGDGTDQLMGQSGNDRLFGQVGNDTLWGGDGDDLLQGFTSSNDAQQSLNAGQTDNDVLMGEGGNDEIFAGLGDDFADGGVGDDLVDGGDGSDTLIGGVGNDQLQGQSGQDLLDAGDGNDVVLAGLGNDTAWGGIGNDELQGNEGNDVLMGESGNDRIFGQLGNDTMLGGDGDDLMVGFTASNEAKQSLSAGESDDDVISGGAGNDNIFAGVGNDQLMGDAGNDLMLGEDGNDSLWGGDGADELQGGSGNDQVDGGTSDDKLFGQVGNDTMYGGDGNDLLMGFTAFNEAKQTLDAGESDDDVLYGGAGSDVLIGGLGEDQLYGGADRDELQGGAGNDVLMGEAGNDNLFGQVGNDTLYGGDGDDYIQGFTASNEAKQTLSAGESDDDFLYGGVGADVLVGGVGNDYLDGGAGADNMIGGQGDDVYVVNSVNDVIYEKAGEGYDVVVTNSNYLLNAQIEELRLLEGFNIHGTGNALNNKIIGNSSDNILDGITGADTMIGGAGSDTYYVDNTGDVVTELAGEGTDAVQSSISYTLGANVENLVLLDFSKPEKGLVDGKNVLVYGYPKRNELDYMQGDAVDNYLGTCALTSIANLLTQTGKPTTESQVVNLAINNNWAVNDPNLPSYQLGGTNVYDQRNILNSYGIRNDVVAGYNEVGTANLLRSGRGVILAVNAGVLWGDSAYTGNGAVNHAVTLTGVVYNESDGSLAGFYLADSGRGKVSDMTRFVDIATFRRAANVPSAYAIYTIEPVKFWQEDINGTGNELANSIAGNRGDNVLSGLGGNDVIVADDGNDILLGGAGNDSLDGGAGDDVYKFNVGDGVDVIADSEGTDALVLGAGISVSQVQTTLTNNRLKLTMGGGSVEMQAGAGKLLEQVQFADGTVWYARADGTGYNAKMTGQLSINGQSQQGQTLTLSNTLSDPDGLGAFSYQWEQSSNGVDWSVMSGVTGSSLVLSQSLVGQRLRAKVSFTDGHGNLESVSSVSTGKVTNINDAPTGSVTISGTATQGQTLSASQSLADADGVGSISWQWLADGQAIAGATASSLTLGQEQVGKAITVKASYTDGYGTVEGVSSAATGKVTNLNDAPTGSVTISGTATQGQTLSASQSLADADGVGSISWQWLADGQAIAGATASSLTLGQEQVGKAITVKASYTDGYGTVEGVSSAATGKVQIQTQTGTSGNDVLNGSAGADRLVGLAGDDSYVVDNAGDVVMENTGEGTDTVYASVSYTLTDNVERLQLRGWAPINGTGNTLNNTIWGTGSANVLDGGAGNDTLMGGGGNDTYVFGRGWGQDTAYDEDGTVGNVDTVQLGAGIGVNDVRVIRDTNHMYLSITGSNDQLRLNNWFVNDASRIEQVRFADGTVWGVNTLLSKANLFEGTSGNDVLNGSAGADRLVGLAGDDTYTVDNAGDVVVENANEGTDQVNAYVSYTLSANVERLQLKGWSPINGTGNALNNTIWGTGSANVLDGGAGNDTLMGGGGNDTYVFGRGWGQDTAYDEDGTVGNVDTVQLGAGIGVNDVRVIRDTNHMYLSITGSNDQLRLNNWFVNDASRIEQVRFADGTVWGVNTLLSKANLFEGTSGNDVLNGSAGADRLVGLAGDDTYTVDNAGDVVVENANEGTDQVNAYVSYTLSANVERLQLKGWSPINGTGNALNNTIWGTGSANVLDGGAGNDTLMGGGGNDTYVFGRGYGIDLIQDWYSEGATDVLRFGTDVASDQLWFARSGNDLQVSIIGTSDKVMVQSWYLGSSNQVEQFKVTGKTLLNSDVEKLVQAMASFSAPASGQMTLPTNYQTALAPVIAANWH